MIQAGQPIRTEDVITGINTTSTEVSNATPNIDIATHNRHTITAQAVDITNFTFSGSPNDGQRLNIRITSGAKSPATSFIQQYNTNNYSNAITLNKPAGTTQNDIMFAWMQSQYAEANAIPTGWTRITSIYNSSVSGKPYLALYYKVAGGSEPANYTFQYYTTMTIYGQISTYRGGFNLANPVDLLNLSNTAYVTSNTTMRGASFNVKKSNSTLLFFGYTTDGLAYTKPSVPTTDWVEDFDDNYYGLFRMPWTGSGMSGNMDATLSGATVSKHAMVIALNPDLNINWGSSITERGDPLPLLFSGPKPISIDLQYNSQTSKWETIGKVVRETKFSSGVLAKALNDASGTSVIPHNLTSTPKKVKFILMDDRDGANQPAIYHCFGTWDEMGQRCIYTRNYNGTGAYSMLSDTAYAIVHSPRYDGSYTQVGYVTVDATNITITWTKTGSPSGQGIILWEAEF